MVMLRPVVVVVLSKGRELVMVPVPDDYQGMMQSLSWWPLRTGPIPVALCTAMLKIRRIKWTNPHWLMMGTECNTMAKS